MPKYAQAKSLPYANPQAPKGGILIQAADGSFNNLNSMNGKGMSLKGLTIFLTALCRNPWMNPVSIILVG